MKDDERKALHEALDLVLDINESRKADTFFSFSGHVNAVTIMAYKGGWEFEKTHDLMLESDLKNPEESEKWIPGKYTPENLVKRLEEFKREVEA